MHCCYVRLEEKYIRKRSRFYHQNRKKVVEDV